MNCRRKQTLSASLMNALLSEVLDDLLDHTTSPQCTREGCAKLVVSGTALCVAHGGGKRCQCAPTPSTALRTAPMLSRSHMASAVDMAHGTNRWEGCAKGARGSTAYCVAHGGGKRCEQIGCSKAVTDRTTFCFEHGGGKQCLYDGCSKGARGATAYCRLHGGGRRCQMVECTKGAEGSTDYCSAHGGGRRCQLHGCGKVRTTCYPCQDG